MKYLISLLFFLGVCTLVSCGERKSPSGDAGDSVAYEVPIEENIHAPEEQVEALTDVVEIDSTDLNRNYRYDDTYMYISKSKMRLYVLNKEDSVLFSCGIACGLRRGDKKEKGDYRTPEGHFRISGMFESTDWIHRTRDGRDVKGCYGPYFLRLATGRFAGIGIHGTNAPRSIGRRASEGCIRVNSKNIVALHDTYAYEGMPVIVSGEYERLPDFAGLGKEERNARKLTLRKDTLHAPSSSADSAAVPRQADSVATTPAVHVDSCKRDTTSLPH